MMPIQLRKMLSMKLFLIYAILLVSPLATIEVFGLLQEADQFQ